MDGWPKGRFVTTSSERSSPNGRFHLGLVGAGRMGRTHLDVLKTSPGIVIAGVTEPRDEVRDALVNEGLAAFASLDEMLS